MRYIIQILILLVTLPMWAEQEVVADLNHNRVSINTTFKGSELLIYGAIKSDMMRGSTSNPDIVIVVEGPKTPLTVRKKEHRWGIWVNSQTVHFDQAPSFYAIISSAPLVGLLDTQSEDSNQILLRRLIETHDPENEQTREFRNAVVRLKEDEGLYLDDAIEVVVSEDTLFRSVVNLPANVREGEYRSRIYLLRDRQVIASTEETILVQKVGMQRWLYALAYEKSALYGLFSLMIAVIAGWLASAFFRFFLNS